MSTVGGIDPFATLGSGSGGATPTRNEAGSAERFLKLLVAQMQNQDPLNPMDNAQITSQMAQINTVNGIETLNKTVQGLNGQFVQMQALQGASLVGRQITLQGDRLAVEAGTGSGGFELAGTADRVKVEILSPAGHVLDTLDLGAQTAGRHQFQWPAASQPDGANLRFRVVASAGTVAVPATPLMRDRVEAVGVVGDRLMLETQRNGDIAYADVKAFN
ncbi:MAG: flagellar hook assembly protein FlgD [Rubrivivax sp.]|nr:flagellar hook assembly protein FlgD [Rubrivivax sp.]MCW5612307.1 flagellar hook assembly protein FlgD [Rubrivivax sp.]